MSIFLTETSARHSILYKQKFFRDKEKKELQSNSQKMMGASNDAPIEVEDAPAVVIRQESDDDNGIDIAELPSAGEEAEKMSEDDGLFVEDNTRSTRRSKRGHDSADATVSQSPSLSDSAPPVKRQRGGRAAGHEEASDDKKKMAMDTSYDGFSIYGRVLCLVVKRKDKKGKSTTSTNGQAMMEDWITSTQMPVQEDD